MNAVGGHIRKLRKRGNMTQQALADRLNMTQQALADRLNVTRQAVSQWENGNTQPDLDTLAAIAGVFGVDMMEVIYGEKKKETSGIDPERRKRYLKGLIVFGAIALMMWVVYLFMRPYFLEQQSRYNNMPTMIYIYFFEPMLYIFVPLAILCGCSLVWDIRIQHKSIRVPVLIVVLTYILFHYIAGWLAMRGGEAPSIVFYYLFFFVENRAIFLLPGIGLFLGVNGRRMVKAADKK